MQAISSQLLLLNGFIILLLGLLCGVPLGRAVNRNKGEEIIRAWRVAHSSIVNGGVMLLVISVVLPSVELSAGWRLGVSVLLSVAFYAFCYALIFGAWKGHRGLAKETTMSANIIYYANMFGAALTIFAVSVLIYGASIAMLLS
jgi:hypothetical protein